MLTQSQRTLAVFSVLSLALVACGPDPSETPVIRIPGMGGTMTGGPVLIPMGGMSADAGTDASPPPPPPARDGGFTILDSGTTPPPPPPTPPPGASTCQRACQNVYQTCMFTFRDTAGRPVSEAQCVSACDAGMFMGAETCLATATCSTAGLNACFSGSPPPPPPPPPATDSGSGGTDASTPPPPPPATGATALEDEVLVLVNQHRARGANCGGTNYPPVAALAGNEILRGTSRAHSTDMATRRYFDHNTPEGRTPFQRMMAAGYNSSPMGENIAAGNGTAAATVTQWMNSPGHCRNIMNGGFRAMGVGYAANPSSQYRHYWTQNFGGR
ncbi:MAG: CAP domain-containing protein [Deltaproteobacteria bacterium]|nr:CAP domain-containing protein [Deltaproteobacteria bacterium]